MLPKWESKVRIEDNVMSVAMYASEKTLRVEAAALTDRGQQRKLNEDAVFQRTVRTETGQNVGLYIVCDGLGGHQAGEVASRLAVDSVSAALAQVFYPIKNSSIYADPLLRPTTIRKKLEAAINKANTRIHQYAQLNPRKAANLGTTITLAFVYEDQAYIANVGDSRTYVWRSGQLQQLTEDHSLAAHLAKMGIIEEKEIAGHPRSNVLSQALGMDGDIEVTLSDWSLQPGDKLLLCSDGFWQAFPDNSELADRLGSTESLVDLCWQLVTEANQRDGSDNISVVVVNVKDWS